MNKDVIRKMQERIIHNIRELNRHGVTAAGEHKEAIHGLTENVGKRGD